MIKTNDLITLLKQNKHSVALYPDSLYYEFCKEIVARLKELDRLKRKNKSGQ